MQRPRKGKEDKKKGGGDENRLAEIFERTARRRSEKVQPEGDFRKIRYRRKEGRKEKSRLRLKQVLRLSAFSKRFPTADFRRCDRPFPARQRESRSLERAGEGPRKGRYEGESIVFRRDESRAESGNGRRKSPSGHVEETEEFCEIFLYPTQVTLSVSKKKLLRYTKCKCILNVIVNCPYSKAPQPTPFVERKNITSE